MVDESEIVNKARNPFGEASWNPDKCRRIRKLGYSGLKSKLKRLVFSLDLMDIKKMAERTELDN